MRSPKTRPAAYGDWDREVIGGLAGFHGELGMNFIWLPPGLPSGVSVTAPAVEKPGRFSSE
jgi:hypothetical protein